MSDKPHVVGYRRVLDGHSCRFCAVASTQRYHKADLMPLHPSCGCTVAPIVGTRDPGRVINYQLLDELKNQSPDEFLKLVNGPKNKRGDWDQFGFVDHDGNPVPAKGKAAKKVSEKAIRDANPDVKVVDHGELGPTLVSDKHHLDKPDGQRLSAQSAGAGRGGAPPAGPPGDSGGSSGRPGKRKPSDSVQFEDMPAAGDASQHAMEQVDRLLEIPDDGHHIPVREAQHLPQSAAGGYSAEQRRSGELLNERIELDPSRGSSSTYGGTMAHEFGHYLDSHYMPGGVFGSPWSSANPTPELSQAWQAFHDAVHGSDAFNSLDRLLPPGWERSYWLSDQECFARAFHQWVAERTGDRSLLDAISPGQGEQWTSEDFEPIAQALDALFDQLGWLKPGVAP